MIYQLLKTRIEQDTLFTNVFGLAKMQSKMEVSRNLVGTKRTKTLRFPIYEWENKVTPLVPNASNRDLIYFERNGDVRNVNQSYYQLIEESFHVVVWLNKKGFSIQRRYEYPYEGDLDTIIKEIRNSIAKRSEFIVNLEFNSAITEGVFDRYTYTDATNAMTIHPFRAYRLNFTMRYRPNCDELIRKEIDECMRCEPYVADGYVLPDYVYCTK